MTKTPARQANPRWFRRRPGRCRAGDAPAGGRSAPRAASAGIAGWRPCAGRRADCVTLCRRHTPTRRAADRHAHVGRLGRYVQLAEEALQRRVSAVVVHDEAGVHADDRAVGEGEGVRVRVTTVPLIGFVDRHVSRPAQHMRSHQTRYARADHRNPASWHHASCERVACARLLLRMAKQALTTTRDSVMIDNAYTTIPSWNVRVAASARQAAVSRMKSAPM